MKRQAAVRPEKSRRKPASARADDASKRKPRRTKESPRGDDAKPAKTPRAPSRDAADDGKRIARMIEVLSREFPDARCMLDHESPFQLLVATILAAQCTDAMVNQVTPSLFAKYPTPEAFVEAPEVELEKAIYRTGFYRNKAKSLKSCCRSLVEKHAGEVPRTMEELTALGGVGRKTANCVLGVSFGVPGIIVDTHVRRLAYRMGYTAEADPDKIEQDLARIAPENEWTRCSHLLAALGRTYCTAKKPRCDECPVSDLCLQILD